MGEGPRGASPIHEGDLVTIRGRGGTWRVLWVRRGAARVSAVAGTGDTTASTVEVGLLDAYDVGE